MLLEQIEKKQKQLMQNQPTKSKRKQVRRRKPLSDDVKTIGLPTPLNIHKRLEEIATRYELGSKRAAALFVLDYGSRLLLGMSRDHIASVSAVRADMASSRHPNPLQIPEGLR